MGYPYLLRPPRRIRNPRARSIADLACGAGVRWMGAPPPLLAAGPRWPPCGSCSAHDCARASRVARAVAAPPPLTPWRGHAAPPVLRVAGVCGRTAAAALRGRLSSRTHHPGEGLRVRALARVKGLCTATLNGLSAYNQTDWDLFLVPSCDLFLVPEKPNRVLVILKNVLGSWNCLRLRVFNWSTHTLDVAHVRVARETV